MRASEKGGIGEKRFLYVVDSTLKKLRYTPDIDLFKNNNVLHNVP